MEKISDYELMRRVVNENDQWAKIHLWHRYQPVVYKRSSYLIKIVGSHWEFEDLIQEFFLAFLNALDYIDLDKIPDETFHFGTIYFFFLRKTEGKIKKTHFKISKIEEESYENLFHPELTHSTDSDVIYLKKAKDAIKHNEVAFKFDESSILFHSFELPSFKKTLSSQQNKILDGIIMQKSIIDISKEQQIPYATVYKKVILLREKAKKHFIGDI